MEVMAFTPYFGYTLVIALVLVALVVWKSDGIIPKPDKECLNESVWTRVRKTLSLRG